MGNAMGARTDGGGRAACKALRKACGSDAIASGSVATSLAGPEQNLRNSVLRTPIILLARSYRLVSQFGLLLA